jgi:hypothetical protein
MESKLMPHQNKVRAVYSRIVHGDVIAIVDHDIGKSVTNDAENVIADLAADFDLSKYQVIYRDTRGIWDQLLIDRAGRFAGFGSINESDLPAALAKLTRHSAPQPPTPGLTEGNRFLQSAAVLGARRDRGWRETG